MESERDRGEHTQSQLSCRWDAMLLVTAMHPPANPAGAATPTSRVKGLKKDMFAAPAVPTFTSDTAWRPCGTPRDQFPPRVPVPAIAPILPQLVKSNNIAATSVNPLDVGPMAAFAAISLRLHHFLREQSNDSGHEGHLQRSFHGITP